MKVAIAGATGFIGRAIIEKLLADTDYDIVALSRTPRDFGNPRVTSRSVDLYSLSKTISSLQGCDQAIYLIHSMSPNSRLVQGNFRDFDYLLADNFSKAARVNDLKQIIYVGGIIPGQCELSEHLESRLEVEHTLQHSDVPTTALRCGLVIGPNGSSFNILVNLVRRLPVMIFPAWMQNKHQPTALNDLSQVVQSCLEKPSVHHRTYSLGSPAVTYGCLVKMTAKALKRKTLFVRVPFLSPTLSKLWVSLFSGASKDLVYPLVDSLSHEMLIPNDQNVPSDMLDQFTEPESAINNAIQKMEFHKSRRGRNKTPVEKKVRSVQRLALPRGKDANWVANAYIKWVTKFFGWILYVRKEDDFINFYCRGIKSPLLHLQHPNRTTPHRWMFYIRDSLLAEDNNLGRLEFRVSPDHNFAIAAVHDFKPRLPWYLYVCTQALAHRYVMYSFSLFLKKIADRKEKRFHIRTSTYLSVGE